MKSWKIGAIAGLIAGIVAGIILTIADDMLAPLGLWEPYFRPVMIGNMVVNIPLFGFWGIVLGIIYSRIYNIIPRKNILKGLIYSLFLYFIISFRMETYNLAYARFLQVAGGLTSAISLWIPYGIVLAILLDFLCRRYKTSERELRIKEYDLGSGFLPAIIAGFMGGLAASIVAAVGPAMGLFEIIGGPEKVSFDFWMSVAGAHIFINMIWGIFFGLMFLKVYDLVPGKKFKKGFYYGLVIYFITTFQIGIWCVAWTVYHDALSLAYYLAWAMFGIGGANGIVFALVLGLLYRKPPK